MAPTLCQVISLLLIKNAGDGSLHGELWHFLCQTKISDSRPGAYRGTYFNTAALIGITGHCFKHHKSIAENKGPV